ncbi:MAG TPA: hypothetical protein VLF69_03110 [Candidatus Saccharimonadales bacterium]|nr:hypothetical protein [Candidatus Saccharimonadales bacterium]
MHGLLATTLTFMADASSASNVIHAYVSPVIRTLCAVASVVCVFFLVNGGYLYMTSSGNPEKLEHAKRVLRNALIGLLIVFAAGAINEMLVHAYSSTAATGNAKLPQLQAIPPDKVSNGVVAILIKAVTGLLNNIIQSVAQPFLHALSFFTGSTELMANNSAVFNLWLVMVGICDGLFVLVVALLGFHVMGATTLGFDEVDVKHLLPRFALIFLGMNTSIFAIDGVIELSNVMIHAINAAGGANSVWDILSGVVKQSGGQGVAALLLMVAFLIFSVILLVYYICRLVTLYIGAVLSPAILLAWLIPGFRDFSETAAKTYLTTIFVLFVHVVILQLAASLFVGMAAGSGNNFPDTLMAMITGLATIIALLKTQSVMMQFNYVSMGSRNMKKLGGQFVNGVSYLAGRGKGAVSAVSGKVDSVQKARAMSRVETEAARTGKPRSITYNTKSGVEVTHLAEPRSKSASQAKTGTTIIAPQVKPQPKTPETMEKP